MDVQWSIREWGLKSHFGRILLKTNVTTTPISQADLSALYGEIRSPSSWHWKIDVKTGWFAHHPESATGQHVKAVLDGLRSSEQEMEAQRVVTALESLRAVFTDGGNKEAADAISLVLDQAKMTSTENGFSVPDLPEEAYTARSQEKLLFSEGLWFMLSRGGLLQSARECVVHRMRVGNSDLEFHYITRTAAIYFRENGQLFVAFDDDPEDNILLVRTEEGERAGANWLVDVHDPLIANAIIRAKKTRRIAPVTGEIIRKDVEAYIAIIGDVASQYAPFIEKHRGLKLQTYVLNTKECCEVTEGKALIRHVRCGNDFSGDFGAGSVNLTGCAHGVLKISTGIRGSLVSYIGLLIAKRIGLIDPDPKRRGPDDVERALEPFRAAERQIPISAQRVFSAGLAYRMAVIHTMNELKETIDMLVIIAPAIAEEVDAREFFSNVMYEPYYSIWKYHPEAAARFFAYITNSRTKMEELRIALKHLLWMHHQFACMPFFIYLLEQRPKQLLDIITTHTVMLLLKENSRDEEFDKEMDFLATFAMPLTTLEADLVRIRNLTTPLNELDTRLQSVLLEQLHVLSQNADLGVFVIPDIPDGSFTQGAYMLFSLIKGTTIEKARAKLPDIKKKEQRLHAIIGEATNFAQLNDDQRKKIRAALQDLSNQFFDLVFDFYSTRRDKKISETLKRRFALDVRHADKKVADSSFQNALLLLKKVAGQDVETLCHSLIQKYLAEETYPFKAPRNAYPWNLPKNKAWLARHSPAWQEPYAQEYLIEKTESGENTGDRERHHLEVVRNILVRLNISALLQEKGISPDALTRESVEIIYKELSKNADKYDQTLLKDLKTQRDALNGLQGQQKGRAASKITIVPEFNPLLVLEMGNKIRGSCLNVYGSNAWSTVVNAIEANKRVLWAKDERGNIIGRLLIAVDNNDQIVKFRVYYATNLSLDQYFDDYLRKLAEKCGLDLNGKASDVSNLIAKRWYRDPETTVDEKTTETTSSSTP